MTFDISSNTQAILLLTAPLILGQSVEKEPLLDAREYGVLARALQEAACAPADLLDTGGEEARAVAARVIDGERLEKLLARGFKLSQALERWRARSIWVLSRADPAYPRRLKARLRTAAPALLYGCGDAALLDRGGLAVVGSRKADDSVLHFTDAVARSAADARRPIVSGGARGIDQAALDGALDEGGCAIAMLADGLDKAATRRAYRSALREQRLVLASAVDPAAGFNVGHAMQRNKFIYALADAALVVQAEVGKGGTWAGAMEQLERYRFGPLYVRVAPDADPAASELERRGALAWPAPADAHAWARLFEVAPSTDLATQRALISECGPDPRADAGVRDRAHSEAGGDGREPQGLTIGAADADSPTSPEETRAVPIGSTETAAMVEGSTVVGDQRLAAGRPSGHARNPGEEEPGAGRGADHRALVEDAPAEALFGTVRVLISTLLAEPADEAAIAAALGVQPGQARAWLARLVEEGVIEKRTRPVRYVVRTPALFE